MIYFIQASDKPDSPIKIGYTADHRLSTRLGALRNASPEDLQVLATMPGTEDDEAAMHHRFCHDRIVREWFDPTPALLAVIAEAQEAAWQPQPEPAPEPVVCESHLHSAATTLERILAAKYPGMTWIAEVTK